MAATLFKPRDNTPNGTDISADLELGSVLVTSLGKAMSQVEKVNIGDSGKVAGKNAELLADGENALNNLAMKTRHSNGNGSSFRG